MPFQFPYSGIGGPLPPTDDPRFPEELQRRLEGIEGNQQELERIIPDAVASYINPVWHTVGDSGEPALSVDWVAWLPGEQPQFFKDSFGLVHLSGGVKPTVLGSITIFTLPVGYRPRQTAIYWLGNDNSTTPPYVAVDSAGRVLAQAQGRPANKVPVGEYVSLGGVHFYAGA